MATFTLTGSSPVNIDSLSGKTGGDTYNVNGPTLTVDQDSRYGLNNDTSSIMGTTTLSATLGGSLKIEGRYIRIIPYDAGSGNVPAYGTTISGSTGSGLLIGVYDTLASAPTAVGAAMPADGYIKIKQWDSVAFTDNDALTGIGATVALDPVFGGTDRQGWLEYVQQESTNFTLSRLNNPSDPVVYGDWFLVGITDGTRATTYQIPTNGVNQYHPGVWVENPNSTAVTTVAWSATSLRATYNVTAHGFETGDLVTITGVTPTAYNVEAYVTKVDANNFYLIIEDNPGTYSSGGTAAGNWEFYPATPDTMVSTNMLTTALKGKFCNITSAGLVRFGHDGTNSSGGYCPPTGRKIRIPSVFMTGATAAARTQNSYNATVSSRPRWITSGVARLDLRNASFNWGFASVSNCQMVNIVNSSIMDNFVLTNASTQVTLDNVGIGSQSTPTAATKLLISTSPLGMTANRLVIGMNGTSTANVYAVSLGDSADFEFTGCKFFWSSPKLVTAAFALTGSRTDQVTITNSIFFHALNGSSTTNVDVKGCMFVDQNGGVNLTVFPMYAINLSTTSNDWTVNGLMIGTGDMPRNGLASIGSSSNRFVMKNVGSYADPITPGVYEETQSSWTRSTTTCTVTTGAAHGLTTGDIIVVYRSSSTAATTLGVFTVTVTGATTFTFTCLNAGAASGTLSYYFGVMARVFLMTSTDTTKYQNIHVRGIRTAPFSMDNTCTNITIENVTYDWELPVAGGNTPTNGHMYGSTQPLPNQIALAAVYGTHIHTHYCADIAVPNATGCSWTRSSFTVTVTKTDHGLVSGSRIQVLYSDNQTGAYSAVVAFVTVLDKDTFTFTGANSGTTSGTVLDYKTSDGMMVIEGNEENTLSTAQYSVVAGTPLFTGAGSIYMPTVNDEVEWVTEKYILDFDSAENMLPFMGGGTIDNYLMTYDIDTGSGYSGVFKNAYFQSAGGGGSAASTTVTLTSTTGVSAGDYVYGIGIASGAYVVSVDSATNLTLSAANSAAVSGSLRFSYLPNITSIPATGFKMKIRLKTMVANLTAITFMRLFFRSTSASRQRLYEQQTLPNQTVTITGATAGSRLQLYDLTSGTELYNGTPTFPYTWTDPDPYVADREVRLRLSYVSGTTAKEFIETTIGTDTLLNPDIIYLVTQTDDTVYNTNAVNGSAVTDITISATRYSLTASKTMAQIYAFAMYTAFTETGIRDYGLDITAVDTANYLMDEVLLKNTSSGPAIAISITGGWVRDFDTGVALDLVDTTGGTLFLAPDHVVAYASASDYALVADAVWSDTQTYSAGEKGKALKDASKAKLLL